MVRFVAMLVLPLTISLLSNAFVSATLITFSGNHGQQFSLILSPEKTYYKPSAGVSGFYAESLISAKKRIYERKRTRRAQDDENAQKEFEMLKANANGDVDSLSAGEKQFYHLWDDEGK